LSSEPEKKKLSILICSVSTRIKQLAELLIFLNKQKTDDIEILVETDNCVLTVGEKRNKLLNKAIGHYVSFIDDDDMVSTNYVERILNSISTKPDCCGIEGVITFDGKNPKRFIHSLKYDKWFEDQYTYYRNPNHLNPIKKELALRVGFPIRNYGEDKDFSQRLYPLLKTEVFIPEPIYFYRYSPENSIAGKRK